MKFANSLFIRSAALVFSLIFLSACGSGQNTQQLANTENSTPVSAQCNAAVPATEDIQEFRDAVCNNLISQSCGSCHSNDGTAPSLFAHDDPNVAYAAAFDLINRDDPASSAIVTKVAGGHNCWDPANNNTCVVAITSYIENWANGTQSSTNQIVLRSPEIKDPGSTKTLPDDSTEFASTVYPLLNTYCSACHVEGQQTPYLGSDDLEVSYEAARTRMDVNTPSASRLVQRLRNEFHNCWGDSCSAAAQEMEDAITALADTITTSELDPDLVSSKALVLNIDGIAVNTGGRYDDDVIAQYEFKTGEGYTAFDTSGIEPALNLTLSGNVSWVGGWGIQVGASYMDEDTGATIPNGKAQGTTSASSKLHSLITATGEYSIEAWVVPGNVTQEDARIVTYSGSSTERNFALGQTLYNYDYLHRSTTTNENQAFSTADADERLQATLQHVVLTFDPVNGRQIFVNGQSTGDVDGEAPGLLNEWDEGFALVLGNETDRNSLWQGTLRMVAIHNRALSPEQITQNYDSGVGEKFFLLFSVSHLIDVPDAFFVFEVSQFDSYSYLFSNPFFISLDSSATPSNIPVRGLKLGINGKEATLGQGFKNVDITLNSTDYQAGVGQTISSQGTIIGLEQGPDVDEFFLSFEQLGDNTNVVVEAEPPAPAPPADEEPVSHIGLKTFDEINASMAVMTGVDKTTTAVANTYNTIRQQLPSVENIDGFLSAHQMAVTQLAIQYCDALVEDTSLRATFFPGFDFDAAANTAFDATGRSQVITPLLDNFVGSSLSSQPDNTTIETELNNLMDTLTSCGAGCAADRTETVVKASCAAVLGSAVMLVQ
ncbi:MAG: LamG domain-containing protein [Salinisphaeraceae bacterium]|nr:LamG domain-containing protein [Salinisphaeraceae bacterium]